MFRKKTLSKEDLELLKYKSEDQKVSDIILGNDHPRKFDVSIHNLFSYDTKKFVERKREESSYISVPRAGK